MSRFFQLSFLLLALSVTIGCLDDPFSPEEQLAKDTKKIKQYLSDNGLTAQSTASGLHYIIEVEGTGGHPDIDSEVTVDYKGYFLDGEVFDDGGAAPAVFTLNGVIDGWQEGIPLFKKGGKGKLFIPSGLGYGPSGYLDIPSNAVLAFDVELVDF